MNRPWISLNLAISADGKIGCAKHRPSRWTSHEDFARLLELRRGKDAVMVGMGTLLADAMSLTVPEQERQPLRCVVSHDRGIPVDHPIFQRNGGAIHLLHTEPGRGMQAGVIHHRGTILAFLGDLKAHHGVETLHCEGGGSLIRSLADLDVIDELHLTLAGHTIFGGTDAPTLTGIPAAYLPSSKSFSLENMILSTDASELFLTYRRVADQ